MASRTRIRPAYFVRKSSKTKNFPVSCLEQLPSQELLTGTLLPDRKLKTLKQMDPVPRVRSALLLSTRGPIGHRPYTLNPQTLNPDCSLGSLFGLEDCERERERERERKREREREGDGQTDRGKENG